MFRNHANNVGSQVADIYTHPAGLREELQGSLGTFPLHRFWGPGTSIESSKWTADASIQVDKEHDPTLTLIYLPHLDYSLQKYGPPSPSVSSHGGMDGGKQDDAGRKKVLADLKEIDGVVEGLVRYYESKAVGARVVILSEYAITRVDRPVYLNRVLRTEGLVQVRKENGGETLDCGECRAFALCDHQVRSGFWSVEAVLKLLMLFVEALYVVGFIERKGNGGGARTTKTARYGGKERRR